MSSKNESVAQSCANDEQETPEKKKPVNIRASVFFDGTGNNQTNTAHTIARDKAATEWRVPAGHGSYENDFSNVARLSQYLLENSPGFDRHFKIYVEGIGTQNSERDIPEGMAWGAGITGVEAKVKSGVDKIVENASKVPNPDKLIQNLRLDVFGFSRGAAAARYCIYVALLESKQNVKERLQRLGFEVSKVEVFFAGLYDTVGSHDHDITDDTEKLHLDAIKHAAKVVHLASADEHRAKFPLTDIRSKGSTEILLPGVHSDIGGGYMPVVNEVDLQVLDLDVFWETKARKAALKARFARERNWLIAQGWCLPGEIQEPNANNELIVTRNGILNTYNRIPLHIMKTWASESTLNFNTSIDVKLPVPAAHADLTKMNAMLGPHGNGNWKGDPELLKRIRRRYFHFSAHYGDLGMGPQFTNDDPMDGTRKRITYAG